MYLYLNKKIYKVSESSPKSISPFSTWPGPESARSSPGQEGSSVYKLYRQKKRLAIMLILSNLGREKDHLFDGFGRVIRMIHPK